MYMLSEEINTQSIFETNIILYYSDAWLNTNVKYTDNVKKKKKCCSRDFSYFSGAVDLADFTLHSYRTLRARETMRLLHEVIGSLLTCLDVKDTLRPDRF